jgi:hypothetical protein
VQKSTSIPQKYHHPAAELYRERLRAIVEGRDPPTELPKRAPAPPPAMSMAASAAGPGGFGGVATGGGGHTSALEPLPGESQEQYIARQRRLNEEARMRMQAKFGGGAGGGAKMQGFGSDPDYDPNRGAFGGVGGGGKELGAELLGAVGRIGSQVQVGGFVGCYYGPLAGCGVVGLWGWVSMESSARSP